jgi:hypothetical protein
MSNGFNELILLAEKKGKKGDGMNAVLVLMQDIRDFQEKLESAIEAQAMEPNREKLEEFNGHIETFWSDLVEIVSGGIRGIRSPEEGGVEVTEDGITEGPKEMPLQTKPMSSGPKLNTPQIPKLNFV